jgi:spore coat protein CotH
MMERWRLLEQSAIGLFVLLALGVTAAALPRYAQPLAQVESPDIEVYAFSMPNNGWAPLTVHFSAYGSRSAHGPLTLIEWDLDGNGLFETDATGADGYVSVTLSKPGTYTVGVRVTDSQGGFATAETTVEVRHPGSASVDYWTLFDDSRVQRIDLLVSQANWNQMWANPGSKTEVEASAIIYGERIDRIGLSMKGNGSLDASGDKKSWKLDFNAFVAGQEFHNLNMMLLHNNFADASLLREKMAYDMAQFAGVPSAFTAYVEVWIDITDDDQPPEYWGVYTLVERPDRQYVASRFGRGNDDGNLYKADAWFEQGAADLAYYGPDIGGYPLPRGRIAYRNMSGDEEADYSDIINLCYIIDGAEYGTPEEWADALEQVFNVDSFLRYLAVIFLNLNLDTYPYTGNNYYLYHHPGTDRFEWIAWDMNNSWGHFAGGYDFPLYGVEQSVGPLQYAPLYTKVFEVERYRVAYRAYVDLLLRHWFNDSAVSTQAQAWHDLIAPYIHQATGDKDFYGSTALYTVEAFDQGWREIAELTRQRSAFIQAALNEETDSP